MSIQQRVVSGAGAQRQPTKISPRPRVSEPQAEPPQEPAARKVSLKVVIITGLIIVGLAAGALYWFVLRPAGPSVPAPPKPGAVHSIESINVNLSDGHYLRLGFAVQLTDKAKDIDGSRTLDAAITLYSGQKYDDVLDPVVREALRQQLAAQLDRIYEGEVMDVYLTDYVAQ